MCARPVVLHVPTVKMGPLKTVVNALLLIVYKELYARFNVLMEHIIVVLLMIARLVMFSVINVPMLGGLHVQNVDQVRHQQTQRFLMHFSTALREECDVLGDGMVK